MGTSIIFKLPDGAGALAKALNCLEAIDLVHIESKPDVTGKYEFYAETMTKATDDLFKAAIEKLTEITQVKISRTRNPSSFYSVIYSGWSDLSWIDYSS